jgi:hypothetical protein
MKYISLSVYLQFKIILYLKIILENIEKKLILCEINNSNYKSKFLLFYFTK